MVPFLAWSYSHDGTTLQPCWQNVAVSQMGWSAPSGLRLSFASLLPRPAGTPVEALAGCRLRNARTMAVGIGWRGPFWRSGGAKLALCIPVILVFGMGVAGFGSALPLGIG